MDQQEEDEDHPRMSFRGSGALYRRRDPAEFGTVNASACVAACFEEFVPNVRDACGQLQQPEYQRMYLWDLYCCDSINCGVYVGNVGQSPNVDLIINECQNIGFPSIEDPGPPSLGYCTYFTPFAIKTSLPPQTWNAATLAATATITPSTYLTFYTAAPGHTTSLTSGTLVSSPSTLVVAGSSTSTSSSIASEANSSRLSGGVTAAIVIFSVIAVLAITALLLFLFRRQSKDPRCSSLGLRLTPYNHRPYHGPCSGSLTHLIPPPPSASSKSVPLTPPAKLSDRKYLRAGQKTGNPRPLGSMTVDGQPLTTSPTPALAQSRIKSRHKRGTATTSNHVVTSTAAPTSPQYSQSSIYSNGGPGTSTVTVDSKKASSIHSTSATIVGNSTRLSSTTRSPRAHDELLHVTDCSTPAGPPPRHALPTLPPNQPSLSAFSVSPTSPQSPTFPMSGEPTTTQQGPVPANSASASISAKELRDLTESYAQETRDSWGSWSGVGGGGPGVVSPGRKKGRGNRGSADRKDEAKTAMASHTLDLEKLGGCY